MKHLGKQGCFLIYLEQDTIREIPSSPWVVGGLLSEVI